MHATYSFFLKSKKLQHRKKQYYSKKNVSIVFAKNAKKSIFLPFQRFFRNLEKIEKIGKKLDFFISFKKIFFFFRFIKIFFLKKKFFWLNNYSKDQIPKSDFAKDLQIGLKNQWKKSKKSIFLLFLRFFRNLEKNDKMLKKLDFGDFV